MNSFINLASIHTTFFSLIQLLVIQYSFTSSSFYFIRRFLVDDKYGLRTSGRGKVNSSLVEDVSEKPQIHSRAVQNMGLSFLKDSLGSHMWSLEQLITI